MTTLVCTALPEITQIVRRAKETLNTFVGPNETRVRYYLNLDDAPFRAIRKFDRAIEDLPKDDEQRMALQALFLIVLRPEIPMKYRNADAFLIGYPEFRDRSLFELEKLRMTANWMDLAFYTLSPKSNKTLLMNLIPRLCEGRSAKYVTGSGQSRATSDRVLIYHKEGKCDKISRPQRKKQKVVGVDEDAIAKLTAITNLQAEVS